MSARKTIAAAGVALAAVLASTMLAQAAPRQQNSLIALSRFRYVDNPVRREIWVVNPTAADNASSRTSVRTPGFESGLGPGRFASRVHALRPAQWCARRRPLHNLVGESRRQRTATAQPRLPEPRIRRAKMPGRQRPNLLPGRALDGVHALRRDTERHLDRRHRTPARPASAASPGRRTARRSRSSTTTTPRPTPGRSTGERSTSSTPTAPACVGSRPGASVPAEVTTPWHGHATGNASSSARSLPTTATPARLTATCGR